MGAEWRAGALWWVGAGRRILEAYKRRAGTALLAESAIGRKCGMDGSCGLKA